MAKFLEQNKKNKKKELRNIGKTLSESKKNKSQLLAIILYIPLKRKKSIISLKSHILTIIKKAIIPAFASNLQKTSINFGNLHASDQ